MPLAKQTDTTTSEKQQQMRLTPGPLCQVPIPERIERIWNRLQRRIYHRLCGDHAGGGHNLFDVIHFAQDLGVHYGDLEEAGLIQIVDDYGWKLPRAPTREGMVAIQTWLEAKQQ